MAYLNTRFRSLFSREIREKRKIDPHLKRFERGYIFRENVRADRD